MPNSYVWTPADGSPSIELTDFAAGLGVSGTGTTGFSSVPYSFATQEYAGMDGNRVQSVKAAANTPTLAMMVMASDRATYQARVRALVHAMRPKAGPGTLTVTSPGGRARSLTCYVTGGMEGDQAPGHGLWWKLALKLLAPDPWWQGTPQTLNVGLSVGAPFFPFFPLVLAPSAVQGQFTVDLSDSDAPAYPVWTITGPGSALTLTNNTTGQQIVVNASLAAGETMVIDTRPGLQSVRRGDGTNLMGLMSSDPALWPLIEGQNIVTAMLTGATSASRIAGTYSPRYAGI